jgi:peptidoglycan/LPS O-acetylase OafA/YrhL
LDSVNSSVQDGKRELRLDALRGVAAFCVAAGHCTTAYSLKPLHNKTLYNIDFSNASDLAVRFLHIVFNANAAVVIFFVLSGYVLTNSLNKAGYNYLGEFLKHATKRAYRILPITIISFFPLVFFVKADIINLVSNMLLLKRNINGVTWSLQVEIVASIILVFLVFLLRRECKPLLLLLFAGLMAMYLSNLYPIFFKYFPAFFLGCFVPDIRHYKNIIVKLAPFAVFSLLFADFIIGYKTDFSIIVQLISSAIVISAVPYTKLFSFLEKAPFVFFRQSIVFFLRLSPDRCLPCTYTMPEDRNPIGQYAAISKHIYLYNPINSYCAYYFNDILLPGRKTVHCRWI